MRRGCVENECKTIQFDAILQSENRMNKNGFRYGKISESIYGADDQIRTGDLILTKDALYRLSYISILTVFR